MITTRNKTMAIARANPKAAAPEVEQEVELAEQESDGIFDNVETESEVSTSQSMSTEVHPASQAMAVHKTQDEEEDLSRFLGFGSFPMAKIQAGQIFLGDKVMKTGIKLKMHTWKSIYIFKSEPGKGADFFHSTDKVHKTSGETVESIFAEWRAKGLDPKKFLYKEYVQVMAEPTEDVGEEFIILSVAPSSIKVMAALQLICKVKRISMKESTVHASVGDPIKTASGEVFSPWKFTLVDKVSLQPKA